MKLIQLANKTIGIGSELTILKNRVIKQLVIRTHYIIKLLGAFLDIFKRVQDTMIL